MSTTLRFIEKQVKQMNVVNLCVTVDAPLWLDVQEILHATSLNIIVVCKVWTISHRDEFSL